MVSNEQESHSRLDRTLPMELKPCIFITSIGRTGSQFFGSRMSELVEGCTSHHEADVLWLSQPAQWLEKFRKFGFARLTWGRLSPRYSLRALSIARQTGSISDYLARSCILECRGPLIRSTVTPIFLEANAQYSAVIDLLPDIFPNARVAHLIRDPRAWVTSWMNFRSGYYSTYDLRQWLPGGRLTARMFPTDPSHDAWPAMSRFERLCWAWNHENNSAISAAAKCNSVRVYRFEDLLGQSAKSATLKEMLDFLTTFPNGLKAAWHIPIGALDTKVHSKAEGLFPPWTAWPAEQARCLASHCGSLMEDFGYGHEPEWISLLETAK
jgi:hypothetical protein